jgi:hypothetical protein
VERRTDEWKRKAKRLHNLSRLIINKFWEELIRIISLHKLTVNNIQCHRLHTKFHPNPPIGPKVAPTSEVQTSAILEWLNPRHWVVWSRSHLQRHLHTRFHPNPPIASKVVKGFLSTHLKLYTSAILEWIKEMWRPGHLQWHHLCTKYHENQPIDSKVISGTHTHTGWWFDKTTFMFGK